MPTYTVATLPTPTTGNTCARVSDDQRGIWCDNGTSWEPINGRGVYRLEDFGGDAQAMIDAVPAASGLPGGFKTGAQLQLGQSLTTMARPLIVDKGYIQLGGLGIRLVSTIRQVGFLGPTIYVAPPDYPPIAPHLAASLVTGAGNSYTLPGTGRQYFRLSDIDTMDLNGLAQLTVECELNPTRDTTGDLFARDILPSSGKISSHSPLTHAFYIYQYNNNSVVAILTTSNGMVTLTTPDNSLPLNQTSHIEFSYDGTTARLFIRGVLKASAAITGTIKQAPHEEVVIGGSSALAFSRLNTGATTDGTIDSIRISSIARHVANFTPPIAKLTADANNLLLINFDNFYRGMLVGIAGTGTPAYIPFRDCGICNNALLSSVELHDMQIMGGLYVTSTVLGSWHDLHSEGARIGMWFYDNDFLEMMRNIKINPTGGTANTSSAGLIITLQSGVWHVDGLDIDGGVYQLVNATGSAVYTRPYLTPNTYTVYSGVFNGGGAVNAQYTLNTLITDYETDATTTPGGSLLFDDVAIGAINTGLVEMLPNNGLTNIPSIVIDGGHSYKFSSLNTFGTGPILKFLSPPSRPVNLDNQYKYIPTQLDADPADLANVRITPDLIGKVTISDTATEATVTFPLAETDAGYQVTFGLAPSASATVDTAYVKPGTQTVNGFTVKLKTAPGSGNNVVVNWMVKR